MTISAMFGLFKKRDTQPADTIAPLLDFIPRFEAGQFKRALGYYKKHNQVVMPEVKELRATLLQSGLIYGRDWTEQSPIFLWEVWKNPDSISTLNARALQIALTAFVRVDHLAEGAIISAMCQQGFMIIILNRLRTLHNNGDITPILRLQ